MPSSLVLLALFLSPVAGPPQEVVSGSGSETESSAARAPANYCGLFCVHAALRAYDVEMPFEKLVAPEFLTGRFGSSVSDIQRALAEGGLVGHPISGMSAEQLRAQPGPVLLHVKAPTAGPDYQHWMLFLGTSDGELKVYDPPSDVGRLTSEELLAIWDGVAVVVTKPGSSAYRLPSLRFVFLLLGSAAMLLAFSNARSSVAIIGVIALVIGVATHVRFGEGLRGSEKAIAIVQSQYFEAQFSELSYEGLQEQLESGCTLIDARLPHAYEAGHIATARNLPVTSGYVRLKRTAREIPTDQPIVVYCQSHRCRWADHVAEQLSVMGLRRVSLYRGGMNGWQASRATQ